MSEQHVPEILKNLREQLKEASEKKERLERVIGGLEEIYALNAKVAKRLDKLAIKMESTTGTPMARVMPSTLTAGSFGKSPAPAKVKDLRSKVEPLILKGMKAAAIAKATGAKISFVYGLKCTLKKEGRLK